LLIIEDVNLNSLNTKITSDFQTKAKNPKLYLRIANNQGFE